MQPASHTLKEVMFCSQSQAETLHPGMGWAIISITEPHNRPVNLHPEWNHILRLEFHDIDPGWESQCPQHESMVLMDEDHAREIVRFVNRLKLSVHTLVVHCRAGVGRSAAVAKWLAERYQLSFKHDYDLYNRHVYSTLLSFQDRPGKDKILFLDFDGVLHPASVYLVGKVPMLKCDDPALSLFCWAPLLEQALTPYPHIKIVLSTTWAKVFGHGVAKYYLPASLRERVIAGTERFQRNRYTRGQEIKTWAEKYGYYQWIAIDDDVYDWPRLLEDKLIACDEELGLSEKATYEALVKKLLELCGE